MPDKPPILLSVTANDYEGISWWEMPEGMVERFMDARLTSELLVLAQDVQAALIKANDAINADWLAESADAS